MRVERATHRCVSFSPSLWVDSDGSRLQGSVASYSLCCSLSCSILRRRPQTCLPPPRPSLIAAAVSPLTAEAAAAVRAASAVRGGMEAEKDTQRRRRW
jgi:hypothetical protein